MGASITGIGANVYDTLIQLPAFPEEDTKCYARRFVCSGGGPAATGLVAASKLGAKTSALAVLSTDAGGEFLRKDYEKYGVDTRLIEVREGESFSATVILNSQTGSRTCLLYRGTLPPLELREAHCQEIADAEILMVDGNELSAAIAGAKVAREAGTRVLYDAGGRYPGVEELLPWVDILIPSAEFALGFTGKTSLEEAAVWLYETYRPEIVVITNGSQGGLFYDGSLHTYAAFSVEVVDSNGAGDVFHGAFAFAVTRGYSWEEACRFSSAVSALKCTRLGARAGVPSLEEVLRFLETGEILQK
ncbi:MAG: PfkB family carbohydrate kinase [Planctomycetia bacterium]|nr:PfkB family carbohydrate kinase [Planctomycetia bacterium]